jgi:hypothetical protein
VATAAFIAAGIAFIPNVAQADDSPHAPQHTTLVTAPAPSPAAAAKPHAFTSPASRSVRLQRTTGAATTTAGPNVSAAGNSIYATTAQTCATETGDGTQAHPYCLVQDAVNAAQPGDTVYVLNGNGNASPESVTVTTSDISIVGVGDQAWIWPGSMNNIKPALILDGVSNVAVSNLVLTGAPGQPTVQVVNSTGVTLDSDYVDGSSDSGPAAVAIDGSSSDITVSRTYLRGSSETAVTPAVSVASGAEDVTLAANLIAASGITATGVQGLDVTNNTIQRGCYPAVAVAEASTGVSIENNLFEDANPTTDASLGGYKSSCTQHGDTWAADVSVDADAASGVTTDYNAFYVYGTDATAPYDWAGTGYPTLAAFRSATQQGTHDLDDTVKANGQNLRFETVPTIDLAPAHGSVVIGSADPDAPGKPSTDFFGTGPFTSRGAVEYVNPNPTLAVAVTGGDDTSAYAGTLTTAITSAPVPVTQTISWGDGTTSTSTAFGSASITNSHRYAKVGEYVIDVTVTDSSGETVHSTVHWLTLGSSYKAYGPTRLLDTRTGNGAPKAKVPAHGTVRLQIGGRGTIPARVTAAVLNLTVTDTTAGGYITAYPEGGTRPATSNVNFGARQTVPNLGLVPVGGNGYVDLYNSSTAPVDLVADINGYYVDTTSASYYQPLSPFRLADTRYGTGTPKRQLMPGGSITVQVAGNDHGLLPSSGISAVALNVTATNTRSSGVVTAYPDGTATPVASNLNFVSGRTIANAVVTPVGSDGKIRVSLNAGARPADVIVDVVGYYNASAKGAYVPTLPSRILDTRNTADWSTGPLRPGDYVSMAFAPGEPDFTAMVLNTTVVNTTGTGWLGVAPDPNSEAQYDNGTAIWPPVPATSTLNWVKGQIVPNLVQAGLGKNGIVDLFDRSNGNMDLVVDSFGYYQTD